MLKCQFHSRENSSERPAVGVGGGHFSWSSQLLGVLSRFLSQERWLPGVFIPRGMVARLRISRGNATFVAFSFCTGLCGFCNTVSIPPITVLQSFTKTSPGFHSRWPLIFFSQSASSKIKGFSLLDQGRLAQVLPSEAFPPCRLDLPCSFRQGWTFRSHHVHSHLCFWPVHSQMASHGGVCQIPGCLKWVPCGLGRKCLWSGNFSCDPLSL